MSWIDDLFGGGQQTGYNAGYGSAGNYQGSNPNFGQNLSQNIFGSQGGYSTGNQGNQNNAAGQSQNGTNLLASFNKNPLGSLGAAIPQFLYGQNQGQYTKQQQNIQNAMTNTSNPMYQNIYNQQKQQSQQSLGDAISQLSAQNRKLSELGRTPLFDNERGGEQLFRGLTQGYQTAQNTAASNTNDILKNAYNQAALTGQTQNKNAQTKAQGQSALGGFLGTALGQSGGMGSMLKGLFSL